MNKPEPIVTCHLEISKQMRAKYEDTKVFIPYNFQVSIEQNHIDVMKVLLKKARLPNDTKTGFCFYKNRGIHVLIAKAQGEP